MTDKEINEITILQKRGLGYRKIAEITKLPLGTLKSYTMRHFVEPEDVCMECGKPLTQADGRVKTFCSRSCKTRWWNKHPHMLTKQTASTFVCPVCRKEFSDYGRRIYCSRACYAEARRKK